MIKRIEYPHPRTFPIPKGRRISAAPPRAPHPAPRNLGNDTNGACRGEAKTRIPILTETAVSA